jgi:hypothetical protein
MTDRRTSRKAAEAEADRFKQGVMQAFAALRNPAVTIRNAAEVR